MARDEYYEMKELAKQKARESDQQMREGKVGRTPERVVSDLQSDALSFIRARPEYKATFDKELERFKRDPRNALTATNLSFDAFPVHEGMVGAGTHFISENVADQRRSFDWDSTPRPNQEFGGHPAKPNVEDLYAMAVGNLIGNRYRDYDTYSGYKPNERGHREGVGAAYTISSLADQMGSTLGQLGVIGNTPDVWAKNADPRDVRQLAALEAYFAATQAHKGSNRMAPESRMDYATPQIKMLQPQKK